MKTRNAHLAALKHIEGAETGEPLRTYFYIHPDDRQRAYSFTVYEDEESRDHTDELADSWAKDKGADPSTRQVHNYKRST